MSCAQALPLLAGWALFFTGSANARAEGLDSAAEWREYRDAGRVEELAAAGLSHLKDEPPRDALKGWIAGEALLSLNQGGEALQLAAKLDQELSRSMAGGFLRYREALLRGDSAAARAAASDRLTRPDAAGYGWGRQPIDWVLYGRLRLAVGDDAKAVMQTCFERALKDDPACEEAFEAMADLALERGDAGLASEKARAGLKKFPKNPRLHAMLGLALGDTARKEAMVSWNRALELHPNEPIACAALGRVAFQMEDGVLLARELEALPAWDVDGNALRLATAMAGGDATAARKLRESFSKNALVLHRAGVLLSGRYRFEEGAALQRAALVLDQHLAVARRALAEDLLRTGHAGEAWSILEDVHRLDGYDVSAFNLLELRDRIAKFTKVSSEHFDIWMEPGEAAVYGDRVRDLLERAHKTLTAKYGMRERVRTTVEIFPEQKDFAVRTFGVPGGDGFLGVCFGPVITAPSPASPRAVGHSWEATLWHEFAHTVTLGLTKNRMPRWLSEGISVYEEQQANPGWGRRFKPRHAARITGGGLTPIEEMAGAFRTGDPAEIDFAYLQAGLVVEWIVQKFGMPVLKSVLTDIAGGADTNASLTRRCGSFEKLNADFHRHAAQWAQGLVGSFAWSKEAAAEVAGTGKAAPRVYGEVMAEAGKAFKGKDLETARRLLEEVVEGAPQMADGSGPYPVLAEVYRMLGLGKEEAQLWEKALERCADLPAAHERLTEIYVRAEDWGGVARTAQRSLGVNPMNLRTVESLWKAGVALGRKSDAADACRRALRLDPAHAARWHSRLGLLLETGQPEEARKHLAEALESNPRDRAALQAFARLSTARGAKEGRP